MTIRDTHYLPDLLAQLDATFSLDEIHALCFALDLDPENLGGDTRQATLRALLIRLVRHDRLGELLPLVRRDRPDEAWPDPPPGLDLFGADPFDPDAPQRLEYEPETARIPAGPFLMGSDGDDPAEAPRHTVELPAYRLGLTPVTNDQYARFLWAGGGVAGSALLWDGNRPPDGQGDRPVLGVTWTDALAYCRWLAAATGRAYTLPSEAQWEKAARGPDGRLYPWGDTWDPDRCNPSFTTITAVRAYPPQSVHGLYDLVGNGREWTLSLWGRDPVTPDPAYVYPWRPDRRNDPAAPLTTRRVYRGGRSATPRGFRCSARGHHDPTAPGPRANRIGFRVALLKDEG